MGWICRSAVERGANDMMNREYVGRSNARGGCGSCGMTRGNDRNDRVGGCGTGGARENERSGGCGICNVIRGESRDNGNRCSGGQTAKWMHRLQVLDFALQELVLYLDMYPDCHRAMAKFHTLREERAKVVQLLEASGTPITALGNDSHERWDWIESPWPWEIDFPGNEKD